MLLSRFSTYVASYLVHRTADEIKFIIHIYNRVKAEFQPPAVHERSVNIFLMTEEHKRAILCYRENYVCVINNGRVQDAIDNTLELRTYVC